MGGDRGRRAGCAADRGQVEVGWWQCQVRVALRCLVYPSLSLPHRALRPVRQTLRPLPTQ